MIKLAAYDIFIDENQTFVYVDDLFKFLNYHKIQLNYRSILLQIGSEDM